MQRNPVPFLTGVYVGRGGTPLDSSYLENTCPENSDYVKPADRRAVGRANFSTPLRSCQRFVISDFQRINACSRAYRENYVFSQSAFLLPMLSRTRFMERISNSSVLRRTKQRSLYSLIILGKLFFTFG